MSGLEEKLKGWVLPCRAVEPDFLASFIPWNEFPNTFQWVKINSEETCYKYCNWNVSFHCIINLQYLRLFFPALYSNTFQLCGKSFALHAVNPGFDSQSGHRAKKMFKCCGSRSIINQLIFNLRLLLRTLPPP